MNCGGTRSALGWAAFEPNGSNTLLSSSRQVAGSGGLKPLAEILADFSLRRIHHARSCARKTNPKTMTASAR
jgi:hypothetical protein